MLFRNMMMKYHTALDPNAPNPGGPAPTPAPAPAPAPTIDPAELAAFQKWKAEQTAPAPTPTPTPAPEDISAKLEREKREQAAEAAKNAALHKGVEFYMGFDGFMAEHGHLFGGFDAKTAKAAHDKIESYPDKAASLRVVSAKAFFAVPANLELLIGADRQYAASMAALGDAAVDAPKAWELVERAIHTAVKSDYDKQVREANGKDPAGGGKNAIDVYKERCRNVGRARAQKMIQ